MSQARSHPNGNGARRLRVLILTADIGSGHDLPAQHLARGLRDEHRDADVTVADGLKAMGWLLRLVIRENSEVVLRWGTWIFDLQYRLISKLPPTRWLARRLLYVLGAPGLARLIAKHRPDVVVSTYPGTTEVLGQMRARGRLQVTICSAITDLAALLYWAHPGVDMHLVTHRESIDEVNRVAGAGRVRWVRGLTDNAFLAPLERGEARRALGLPSGARIVVVSGGGWAVGDLKGAVDVALERPDTYVVCLAGCSERLRRRLARHFRAEPRVQVWGFTDRMCDLLAAADALVHSTGGLTVLEALMTGCAPVSYGWGVGHVRANNEAFHRFGLADVARSRRELAGSLERRLEQPLEADRSFDALPTAASVVSSMGLGLPVAAPHPATVWPAPAVAPDAA
jgi:UDP-N-acetylglucosamine:LPS N-acetylglucosamine transferase